MLYDLNTEYMTKNFATCYDEDIDITGKTGLSFNKSTLWPIDNREDYRSCASSFYSLVQIFPKALHSD